MPGPQRPHDSDPEGTPDPDDRVRFPFGHSSAGDDSDEGVPILPSESSTQDWSEEDSGFEDSGERTPPREFDPHGSLSDLIDPQSAPKLSSDEYGAYEDEEDSDQDFLALEDEGDLGDVLSESHRARVAAIPSDVGDLDFDDDESLEDMLVQSASRPSSIRDDALDDSDSDLQAVHDPLEDTDSDLRAFDDALGDSSLDHDVFDDPLDGSGPVVIVDEESGDSLRFSASILDDEAKPAGGRSARVPKKKRPPKRSGRSRRAQWTQDSADFQAPTMSGRLPQDAPRRRPTTEIPPSRHSTARLIVAALLASVAVAGVQELRKRRDLQDLDRDLRAQLEVVEGERDDARDLASANQRALDVAEDQHTARERDLTEQARQERYRRSEALTAAEQAAQQAEQARQEAQARQDALAEAQRQHQTERQRQDQRAQQALAEAEREVEQAAARAREDALAEAEQAHASELERLRRQLRAELATAEEREGEDALAESVAEERDDWFDDFAPSGGGSASEGVDDWDDFFSDIDGGSDSSGGSSGGGGDDPFGDDLFADFDSALASGGGGGGGDGEDEEITSAGIVDGIYNWIRDNIHGSVGYKNLSHFSRGPNRNDRKTRHEARIKLEYRGWLVQSDDYAYGLRVVSALDIRLDDDNYAVNLPQGVDDEERRRPIVTPDELYAAAALDWLEVRGGWQRYAWGTGDLYNPTDNLNPIDYSDLFDARRIPVLSASVNMGLGPLIGFDADKSLSLELVAIPTFTRTRTPIRGRRWDVLQTSPLPILRPDDPEGDLQNAQFGARSVLRAGGWDVSLSAFSGYNDLPSPELEIVNSRLSIVPKFDRINILGADFATTLGFLGIKGKLGDILAGIQLHGEAAHTWTEGGLNDDILQYVLGFSYQFADVIGEHDLTLILEYAGDWTSAEGDDVVPGARLDRIFRGAVLWRLQYDVNTDLSFAINGAMITHGAENLFVHPTASWNVTDYLQLELGGDVFYGPDDTFFGQFERDGRVIMEARFVF